MLDSKIWEKILKTENFMLQTLLCRYLKTTSIIPTNVLNTNKNEILSCIYFLLYLYGKKEVTTGGTDPVNLTARSPEKNMGRK